jgi:hypothetical protein
MTYSFDSKLLLFTGACAVGEVDTWCWTSPVPPGTQQAMRIKQTTTTNGRSVMGALGNFNRPSIEAKSATDHQLHIRSFQERYEYFFYFPF